MITIEKRPLFLTTHYHHYFVNGMEQSLTGSNGHVGVYTSIWISIHRQEFFEEKVLCRFRVLFWS